MKYMFFIDTSLRIHCSVTDDLSKLFVLTFEGTTAEMIVALSNAQQIADATIIQLDLNRQKIENDSMQISKNNVSFDDKRSN